MSAPETSPRRAAAPGVSLTARVPDPAAFAAFGAFLRPPAAVGQRAFLRHPHAAQLFLPVGVSRYLVTVMPSDEAGAPDPARAEAFLVPGTLGVAYRPGTWHAGIAALDREASFAVLMWRGGAGDDVFASIPPVDVHADDARTRGGDHG